MSIGTLRSERFTLLMSDVRRHLQPLLQLRPDLTLIGRVLVINPARHLLRGAYFAPTEYERCVEIGYFVRPLFFPPDAAIVREKIHRRAHVDDPRFQAWLIESLATEIFVPEGKLRTIDSFPFRISKAPRSTRQQIVSCVLIGGWEYAEVFIDHGERGDHEKSELTQVLDECHDRVDGDIDAFCTEHRVQEAETVKAMGLDRVWECAPFPAELAQEDDDSRSSEPAFPAIPWIERPSWLLQEMPDQPGDVRYGDHRVVRDDRLMLRLSMTAGEAEERHRTRRLYTLATRTQDEILCVITRLGTVDDHGPAWVFTSPVECIIQFVGRADVAYAQAQTSGNSDGLLELFSLNAIRRDPPGGWSCQVDHAAGTKTVIGAATNDETQTTTLIPDERKLFAFPEPAFGEHAELIDRVRYAFRIVGGWEIA